MLDRPALPAGPFVIAGLGRAGSAAARALLSARGATAVLAWDASTVAGVRGTARRLRRRHVQVSLGGDGLALLAEAGPKACVVKSPGIDFDIPLLRQAREMGFELFDELEIGWRLTREPVIAVTGTNGKSTTAHLIAAVVQVGGRAVQLVGNSEFGPPLSAATLGRSVVCEVSSFQLEGTTSFLPELAVFTNLTPEHLTRHGSMDRYGAAKRRMFVLGKRATEAAIVNLDDPFGRSLAGEVRRAGGSVLTYGFHVGADVRVTGASWDMRGATLALRTPQGRVECRTRLPGAHNVSNAAAAFAAGHALGLPAHEIATALAGATGPPGRWELVSEDGPFDVIVDYAHTPDGIRQVLRAMRAVVDAREGAVLRTVFGAVGLHDAEKARDSAWLARRLSDHLILTTGTAPRDPRIVRLAELRHAANTGGEMEIVLDRHAAIAHAITAAGPGDVVAVLGMGALRRQILDAIGTTMPFDDREASREVLAHVGAGSWS